MHEPQPPTPVAHPFSTPHSAPVAWLRSGPPTCASDAPALRAAIELVLTHHEAVAEIVGRAPPAAFTRPTRPDRTRHDGWAPDRIATFLEILADTGIVTEACRTVGMSREAAYELRNRDPVVDAAWTAALARARPVLADGLLERSISGTVEQHYRDGVLVHERRYYESWLALAVLKRLDKQAGDDRAEGTLSARMADDWQASLDVLREGGTAAVPALLAAEVDKVDTPPHPSTGTRPKRSGNPTTAPG
ncbi:MAG: hypothetical protein ABIQ32_02780 [Sphingomicrobium sp.]